MKLNHLNLGVTEIAETAAMFETYFGLRRAEGMPFNEKMAFLRDDNEALISLFRVKDAAYPKIFHIGFIQDSVEQVLEVHAKLTSGGFEPDQPKEEHGRTTFYVGSPGGVVIEVDAFRLATRKPDTVPAGRAKPVTERVRRRCFSGNPPGYWPFWLRRMFLVDDARPPLGMLDAGRCFRLLFRRSQERLGHRRRRAGACQRKQAAGRARLRSRLSLRQRGHQTNHCEHSREGEAGQDAIQSHHEISLGWAAAAIGGSACGDSSPDRSRSMEAGSRCLPPDVRRASGGMPLARDHQAPGLRLRPFGCASPGAVLSYRLTPTGSIVRRVDRGRRSGGGHALKYVVWLGPPKLTSSIQPSSRRNILFDLK